MSTISRRSAMKSLAVPALLASPVAVATVSDDRKYRLLAALAEFDAAVASEAAVAHRLNACRAIDDASEQEYDRLWRMHESCLHRERETNEAIEALANEINPAALAIVSSRGIHFVLRSEDAYLGLRLRARNDQIIDLR